MFPKGYDAHSRVNAFTHRAKGSCWQLRPKPVHMTEGLAKAGSRAGWGSRPLASSLVTVLSLMTRATLRLGVGGSRLASDPSVTHSQAPSRAPRGIASWVPCSLFFF